MGDILFETLEKWHGDKSWGRFLDAGTGVDSLKWAQRLNTTSWTAITADDGMKRSIESSRAVVMRQQDRILVGNWMDESFCSELGTYDTILADYLIGAVDGFSPYTQDLIIEKLKKHMNPGGKLYIIGMNPIPDTCVSPASLVSEVRRTRDACILLAGHRPYREFPVEWMQRHLKAVGLVVTGSKSYTILHNETSILRQVRVAESKLALMPNSDLRNGMENYLSDLKARIHQALASTAEGRVPLSFDYCLAAELEESVDIS